MPDIAGVVILYFPDSNLKQRLTSYLDQLELLIVIDNTDQPTIRSLSFTEEKIVYLRDGENKGISVRLNQAADIAVTKGFQWLLTMDQDSQFTSDNFPNYIRCLKAFENKNEVAMFGVQLSPQNINQEICEAEEITHLITSGSIVNLTVYKHLGPFDEALFIDRVDHEYCFRARSKNYKIIRFNNIFMEHNLGTLKFGRSFKNLKITPRVLHSPVRMYYIVRNYFYLRAKYNEQFDDELDTMRVENWMRIKNNFLYRNDRFKLLRYIVRAYVDYRKGNMGKLKN